MDQLSDDQKIDSIIKRINELSLECTNKDEFILQLKIILSNDEYIYDTSEESHIFMYYYIHKNRQYLFDLNDIAIIQVIINESIHCITSLKQNHISSIYLRNIAIQIITETTDELIDHLRSL
jgi:hypothetical protein